MATRAKIGVILIVALAFSACVKSVLAPPAKYKMPNCDFESWTADDELQKWKTNSCPACLPAYNTYTVQKTSEAYHGLYAAKFVYNDVFSAAATTKFPVSSHPSALTGFVKCRLYDNDTTFIKVGVYKDGALVDSGIWMSTVSIKNYTQFTLPITQSTTSADSVSISVRGGHVTTDEGSSTLWADYFSLH